MNPDLKFALKELDAYAESGRTRDVLQDLHVSIARDLLAAQATIYFCRACGDFVAPAGICPTCGTRTTDPIQASVTTTDFDRMLELQYKVFKPKKVQWWARITKLFGAVR